MYWSQSRISGGSAAHFTPWIIAARRLFTMTHARWRTPALPNHSGEWGAAPCREITGSWNTQPAAPDTYFQCCALRRRVDQRGDCALDGRTCYHPISKVGFILRRSNFYHFHIRDLRVRAPGDGGKCAQTTNSKMSATLTGTALSCSPQIHLIRLINSIAAAHPHDLTAVTPGQFLVWTNWAFASRSHVIPSAE